MPTAKKAELIGQQRDTASCVGKESVTRSLSPTEGSALDPFVEEITWEAWRMVAASPRRLSDDHAVHGVRFAFHRIAEVLWEPGRTSMFTEASRTPEAGLTVSLAVGITGRRGASAAEAALAARLVADLLAEAVMPYQVERIDPTTLLNPPEETLRHSAVIRQPYVVVEGIGSSRDLEVLSRMNPTVNPWGAVVRLLSSLRTPARVRATLMPTEVTVSDRLRLQGAIVAAHELVQEARDRPDVAYQAERALTTLVDISASFATPVFCSELSVTSSQHLPALWIRSLASSFTSDTDVMRFRSQSVVAGQRHILGGFDIEPGPPELAAALRAGLPARGGLVDRDLRDLVSLVEVPLGWPIPIGEPVAGVPSGVLRTLRAPDGLDCGKPIGHDADGRSVHVPPEAFERHSVITGSTGTGKTAVLTSFAVDDLRTGRTFVFVDCHGQAADRIVANADALGRPVLVLDPLDPGTGRLRPLPSLGSEDTDLTEVQRAAGRLCDAIATAFPDSSWTGPRWHNLARSLMTLAAVHGAEIAEIVEWVNDPDLLREACRQSLLPPIDRANLLNLHSPNNSDAAGVRDWIVCKFNTFTSSIVRRILASAGAGVDPAAALAEGIPVIVNLGALTTSDAAMVGHLVLATVLDAAFDRRFENGLSVSAYIDEAHRYPMRGLERVINEGRKFGLTLMFATQSLALLEPSLRDTASSAAVKIAFRQAADGATYVAPLLDVHPMDLLDLPDFCAYIKVAGKSTCSITADAYPPCPPVRGKASSAAAAVPGAGRTKGPPVTTAQLSTGTPTLGSDRLASRRSVASR
jgi:hypothetical protein